MTDEEIDKIVSEDIEKVSERMADIDKAREIAISILQNAVLLKIQSNTK